MLWRCSELRGYGIAATDGTVGSVDDPLFEEARWTLRWAVVDTGGWLSGRKVLLPASAFSSRPGRRGGSRPSPSAAGSKPGAEAARMADPDLRSVRDTIGHAIVAQDGAIGHVEDFLVDEGRWPLRYRVVDTRKWLPGRKVPVAPPWIRDIDWADRSVSVDLSRAAVRDSPEYDPRSPIGRSYEAALRGLCGRQGYWGA
jgi:hypothetical protein